jgi:hypothetical protein
MSELHAIGIIRDPPKRRGGNPEADIDWAQRRREWNGQVRAL